MVWVTAVKVRGRKAEKANETLPKKLKMNSNECLVIVSALKFAIKLLSSGVGNRE